MATYSELIATQNANLVSFYKGDVSGATLLDSTTSYNGAITGADSINYIPFGDSIRVVRANNDFINCGRITELENIQKFTISFFYKKPLVNPPATAGIWGRVMQVAILLVCGTVLAISLRYVLKMLVVTMP